MSCRSINLRNCIAESSKGLRSRGMVLACCIVLFSNLVGCTTAVTPEVAPAQNTEFDVLWPAVSLFPKEPSAALRARCDEFTDDSALQGCQLNATGLDYELGQLADSGFFAEVRMADESVEYTIAITKATFSESGAENIAKAALAGATLLVVPVTLTQDVVVEVVILWRDIPINRLLYEFVAESTISLFTNPEEGRIELAGKLSARIIDDASASGVFTGAYLADALQATNYTRDLVTPDEIGLYRRVTEAQQAGPMEGAWVSYIRPEFTFDEYAVNIYPVRSPDSMGVRAYLAEELLAVKAQVEVGLAQHVWKSAVFAPALPMTISAAGDNYAGVSQSVQLVDDRDQPMVGRIYLFVVEDKVLRFINVVPAEYLQPSANAFLAGFLENSTIPEESVFMAEMRNHQKTQSPQ